jgi:nicotinate-nucleotide pyrophosphorylase (carboxylating)
MAQTAGYRSEAAERGAMTTTHLSIVSHLQADIREEIFRNHMDRVIHAVVTAESAGVISGMARARSVCEPLKLVFSSLVSDGEAVAAGFRIARIRGNPLQIVRAEEVVLGELSKSSGIATAARKVLEMAGPKIKVVSGGSKKMPQVTKELVRQAISDGGLDVRIAEHPFIYLDKNYVRILGGIGEALRTVAPLAFRTVIQVRGETAPVSEEAIEAARAGAEVIMIDTGNIVDLQKAARALRQSGLRGSVLLAYAGNIRCEDIPDLLCQDVDILDIGYAIVDAPCLPMRMDVVP